jgi:hypothetical protein
MVEEKDITVIKPLVNVDTAIALTVDLNVFEQHKRITLERVDGMMKEVFRNNFPLHKVNRIRSYNRMTVYEARVPYYIRKLQKPQIACEEPKSKCKEVSDYEQLQTVIEIPSSRSLGIFG